MNDLELIRALDDTVTPDASRLRGPRAQLLAAVAHEPERRRRRRRTLVGAGTIGVAAATAAVLLLIGTGGSHGPARAATVSALRSATTTPAAAATKVPSVAPITAPTTLPLAATTNPAPNTAAPTTSEAPSTSEPLTTARTTAPRTTSDHPEPPPPLMISPAAFLIKAATAARANPDLVPRPDQFLYVKDGSYQAWLSMDGTHDGLVDSEEKSVLPGCRSGTDGCTPQPAYLADAPTTAAGMAAYVIANAGSSRPNSIGKELQGIAEFNYLRPAARAALFEAAPLLPGLTLKASSVTNQGTQAVAVTWNFGQSSTTLLFNPRTYAYIGCTTLGENGEPGGTGVAIEQAVVDRVGQQP